MTQNTPESYFRAGYSIFQHLGAEDGHTWGEPKTYFYLTLSIRDLETGKTGFDVFNDRGAKMAAEAMKRNHPAETRKIDKALQIQLKWNAKHQQEEI